MKSTILIAAIVISMFASSPVHAGGRYDSNIARVDSAVAYHFDRFTHFNTDTTDVLPRNVSLIPMIEAAIDTVRISVEFMTNLTGIPKSRGKMVYRLSEFDYLFEDLERWSEWFCVNRDQMSKKPSIYPPTDGCDLVSDFDYHMALLARMLATHPRLEEEYRLATSVYGRAFEQSLIFFEKLTGTPAEWEPNCLVGDWYPNLGNSIVRWKSWIKVHRSQLLWVAGVGVVYKDADTSSGDR